MRPDGEALQKAGTVRADILALLREKRYEEALALLYRARAESPANRELQKSIEQVKEFLVGAYAKRLGGLDRIAAPIPPNVQRSPDMVMLARYIDGSSTIGDVAQMCPLGQLRTLQVLVGLYTGAEPPRVDSAVEAPRIDSVRSTPERAPTSGLRVPNGPVEVGGARPEEAVERAPETARSASTAQSSRSIEVPRSVETPRSSGGTPYSGGTPRSSGGAPYSAGAPRSSADAPRSSVGVPRSGALGPRSGPISEEQRKYEEAFGRGTSAFVQRRYKDAIAAFEECDRLRPGDQAATVMVRRCERGLAGGG